VVGIVLAFILYLGARHQANSALQTVKEQQQAELQKLKEQHSVDLQKLREQQQVELEKLKEQQNAKIQRIREQSLRDIERIKVDMEKQAELYEKNAQTDIIRRVVWKSNWRGHVCIRKLGEVR
jgi:F0F1-type ATP synthase membrane subunit b/b'